MILLFFINNKMEKRNIIVLTLISVIISTIIILISYFGIQRYVSLHFQSNEQFILNYSNLEKADTKQRVVISFTTTPDKINKIEPMIRSLLDQTVKVDQISLNIPYKFNGKSYNIPKEYNDILNIFRTEKDYNSGSKIIPTLLRECECGTKIIYLDDNQIYGKDLIETLVKESNENPDKAIYTKGDMDASGAVLIKPEFFEYSLIKRTRNEKFNDKWIKNNLKVELKKVPYTETYKSYKI
jgi:hypothetical protein